MVLPAQAGGPVATLPPDHSFEPTPVRGSDWFWRWRARRRSWQFQFQTLQKVGYIEPGKIKNDWFLGGIEMAGSSIRPAAATRPTPSATAMSAALTTVSQMRSRPSWARCPISSHTSSQTRPNPLLCANDSFNAEAASRLGYLRRYGAWQIDCKWDIQ